MTIDFFLCGYKGLQVLKTFCASGRSKNIQTVFADKDKYVVNDYFNEIERACNEFNLNFKDRTNFSDHSSADYRILAGWRWRVKETKNTIVLHDALLPSYRGFAPLVNALVNGEKMIGATAFLGTVNYDSGPVIMSKSIAIEHPLRIEKAIEEISRLYVNMVMEITSQLLEGRTLLTYSQDESKATYSLWRDEQDYFIDWSEDNEKILRTIYALSYPYPGACTLLNGSKIIVENAELVQDVNIVNRQSGKVIFSYEDYPVVVCGKGLLKITGASDMNKLTVLPLKKFRSRFGQ
jgi:methionyl-tRNA formyltransferase